MNRTGENSDGSNKPMNDELLKEDQRIEDQINPYPLISNPYQPKPANRTHADYNIPFTDMIPISTELPPTPDFLSEKRFFELLEKVDSIYFAKKQKAMFHVEHKREKEVCHTTKVE